MDDEHARQLLALARERIEKALVGRAPGSGGVAGSDDDESDPFDAADSATDLLEEEIDQGHVVRLREELEAIERAERRLAEGSYGRSIESGEPIPDARLEAVPWAERTVAEQERYDRLGA